jgi:pimeloyl-ACP methyl ester carboxylesterase
MVFLHGGWGYQIYPYDNQISRFGDRFRIIIPDRSGYGGSGRIEDLPPDFHSRAAIETSALLDALGLERPVIWGHSDGAVIGAIMGLSEPSRFAGLILEAVHFYRRKPGSRQFFETMAADPELLGERVTTILRADHGEDYWREIILKNGRAWLRIADESSDPTEDLYNGKLSELTVPTLFVHGSKDPRTEPGELDAVASAVGRERIRVIDGGGHSPHSERSCAEQTNGLVEQFLKCLGLK